MQNTRKLVATAKLRKQMIHVIKFEYIYSFYWYEGMISVPLTFATQNNIPSALKNPFTSYCQMNQLRTKGNCLCLENENTYLGNMRMLFSTSYQYGYVTTVRNSVPLTGLTIFFE